MSKLAASWLRSDRSAAQSALAQTPNLPQEIRAMLKP
jgi:hypothetical protein